jgi:hypothetical protein
LISADVNLLDGDVLITEKNETLLLATVNFGQEDNGDKPERIFMSCEENLEECHNIK